MAPAFPPSLGGSLPSAYQFVRDPQSGQLVVIPSDHLPHFGKWWPHPEGGRPAWAVLHGPSWGGPPNRAAAGRRVREDLPTRCPRVINRRGSWEKLHWDPPEPTWSTKAGPPGGHGHPRLRAPSLSTHFAAPACSGERGGSPMSARSSMRLQGPPRQVWTGPLVRAPLAWLPHLDGGAVGARWVQPHCVSRPQRS